MTDQPARYDHFASLHVPGNPVVLFNVWDVGSALAVQRAGAKAIATGSHSVAEARGYEDGENTPLDFVIANAARIAEAVDVPVTIDFEAGYGGSPEAVAASLAQLLETGIVGVNIEDGLFGAGIRPVGEQVLRLKALSAVRASSGAPAWLNARTDVFPGRTAGHPSRSAPRIARARRRLCRGWREQLLHTWPDRSRPHCPGV